MTGCARSAGLHAAVLSAVLVAGCGGGESAAPADASSTGRRPLPGATAATILDGLDSATGLSGQFTSPVTDGTMTLDFQDAKNVRVRMSSGTGLSDIGDSTYDVVGDQVTIRMPDGRNLVLTRTAGLLEGSFNDVEVRFERTAAP